MTERKVDQDVAEDVELAEKGPDSATFIAKGDPIPPELAGLPRRPARGGPRKRG